MSNDLFIFPPISKDCGHWKPTRKVFLKRLYYFSWRILWRGQKKTALSFFYRTRATIPGQEIFTLWKRNADYANPPIERITPVKYREQSNESLVFFTRSDAPTAAAKPRRFRSCEISRQTPRRRCIDLAHEQGTDSKSVQMRHVPCLPYRAIGWNCIVQCITECAQRVNFNLANWQSSLHKM